MKWFKSDSIRSRLLLGYLIVFLFVLILGGWGILTLTQSEETREVTQVISDAENQILRSGFYLRQFIEFGDKESSAQVYHYLSHVDELLSQEMEFSEVVKDSIATIIEKNNTYRSLIKEYVYGHTQNLLAKENWNSSGVTIGEKFRSHQFVSLFGSLAVNMLENHTQLQLAGLKFSAKPVKIDGSVNVAQVNVVKQKAEKCKKLLEKARKRFPGDTHQKVLTAAINEYNEYLSYLEMINMLLGDEKVILDKILMQGDEMLALSSDLKDTVVTAEGLWIERTKRLTLFLLIVAALASLVISQMMAKSIVTPIREGVAFAKGLANGELFQSLQIKRKDEIGELVQALNQMSLRFREIVAEILLGAKDMDSSSSKVRVNAQNLAELANEYSASVEEISSTMEEMTANIQGSAHHAAEMEVISNEAFDGVQQAYDSSGEAVTANNRILDRIQLVNRIAQQTNILALNAAVEAARAGEHGKGFSVVAREVGNLATRSHQIAREIIEMAKESNATSMAANEKLETVMPKVNQSHELIKEITAASEEQRMGVEQVNNAMNQFSIGIQSNVNMSEELAGHSDELNDKASGLERLVEFFKVKE
ncbi:methyl-accepting chemotaxis protein [Marinilabiliaceae bacterium JC017]|nr:methyl-accepting chemotaxis protein [Marinilabiliaceae bacterium JC017]